VRRVLVVTTALSLTSVLVFASAGSAQTPTIVRGFVQITANTTPKRDRTKPYTFTTTGRIIPPSRFCNPGQNPTRGANCVPILCPPGGVDTRYCLFPGRRTICSGTVTVRFSRVTTTISARNVQLRSDCTYRSRVRFKLGVITRRGPLHVRARFQGNPIFLPSNSRRQTVRAG
jgi:hypothetical protein